MRHATACRAPPALARLRCCVTWRTCWPTHSSACCGGAAFRGTGLPGIRLPLSCFDCTRWLAGKVAPAAPLYIPLLYLGHTPRSRNVVVIDTSNEVAGDASVPHPCIGGARRMMVRDKRMQHDTMVEATANHNPDVR